MFKDVKEVQNFILWAKSQQLKRVRLGELEFELVPDTIIKIEQPLNVASDLGERPSEATENKEDEDLLFWSSGGKTP